MHCAEMQAKQQNLKELNMDKRELLVKKWAEFFNLTGILQSIVTPYTGV